MKSNHTPNIIRSALLTGAALFIAGAMTAQASSSFITFSVDMSTNLANGSFNPGTGDIVKVRGTFDGWSAGGIVLSQVGSSSIYTNTANDTTDPNGFPMPYIFLIEHPGPNDSYETVADFNNRCVYTPTNSGGSLVLGTPVYGDAGPPGSMTVTFQVDMAEQINLGYFTNNSAQTVEVHGNFNGWASGLLTLTNNPAILRTNQYGVVTADVYVGSTNITSGAAASPFATSDYKYVIQPGTQYEGVSASNSDSGGNRFFVFTNGATQVIPVAYYSDAPLGPPVNVGFSVDMTAVALSGDWQPSTVQLDGSFNSWGAGVICTNDPNGNTNIYSCVVPIGSFTAVQYQFRYLDTNGSIHYDNAPAGPGVNRQYTVPPNITSTNLPTVYFANNLPSDVLNEDTVVTFTVNMSNAVAAAGSADAGHQFDASVDNVFLNGDFLGWLNWDPISLSAQQMTAVGATSNYTFTVTFPSGHARQVNYKYGMNGADDEAPSGQNHLRYIRSTNGVYNMPVDIFGTQTVEPKIGGLVVGTPSGAHVPVSWLPYPTALLQTSTNLTIPNVNGGF